MNDKITVDNTLNETLAMVELTEASDLIRGVGDSVYNIPRGDGDLNLYAHIMNRLSFISDEEDVNIFNNLLLSVEPNIHDKNDIVQKVLISSVLLRRFFILKHENDEFDIFNTISGIKPELPNESWLELMLEYTIPLLLNNNLIKELKND